MLLGLPVAVCSCCWRAWRRCWHSSSISPGRSPQTLAKAGGGCAAHAPGPEGVRTNPPLPLGAGSRHCVARWWRSKGSSPRPPRPNRATPAPLPFPVTIGRALEPPTRAIDARFGLLARRSAGIRRPPCRAPRIIGGNAQVWRLPVMPRRCWRTARSRTSRARICASARRSSRTTLAGFGVPVAGGGGEPGPGRHPVRPAPRRHHPQRSQGRGDARQGARVADPAARPTTSRWRWPPRRCASRRRCRAAISSASKCPTCRSRWSRCAG